MQILINKEELEWIKVFSEVYMELGVLQNKDIPEEEKNKYTELYEETISFCTDYIDFGWRHNTRKQIEVHIKDFINSLLDYMLPLLRNTIKDITIPNKVFISCNHSIKLINIIKEKVNTNVEEFFNEDELENAVLQEEFRFE
jgi:hypothetical protein